MLKALEMTDATAAQATWRTVLADAVGPARVVMDVEGARGEWRRMLERNGYLLLEPGHGFEGPLNGAVVARHLVGRIREPGRAVEGWRSLLEPGGRIVLLESATRHGGLGRLWRRPTLIFPPREAPRRSGGLSPADAALLLDAQGLVDIRCFALPVPPAASLHYLVSGRLR